MLRLAEPDLLDLKNDELFGVVKGLVNEFVITP